MATEDLDRRLAQDVADAELAHAAERYATIAVLVRERNSSQAMLRAARRRLQEAAHAYCQAYGHADAP
jgi:hypothetical protein